MKITTLIEDSQKDTNLGSEHGVSFYIETNIHKILFDTGQSELFIKNAKKLKINLAEVDTLVISHGHYDHGGGLSHFLKINDKAKIYIQKTAFDEYYSLRKESGLTEIGLNRKLDKSKFILLDKDIVIDDEITIFSSVKTTDFFPSSNKSLFKKVGNEIIHDDFQHEQNLIIKSDGLYVLFAGCAHKGIINIINRAEQLVNNSKLHFVFGGFHLKSSHPEFSENEENILEIARILKDKQIFKYFTGHCTGDFAYNIMKSILNERIESFYPGLTINV